MRVSVAVLPFFLLIILSTGCKTREMNSHWSSHSIVIDGQMSDWAGLPVTYFEDQEVSIGLANDTKNFYIIVRHRDAALARSIWTSGMKLWLNNEGNKDKFLRLEYRGGPSREQMRQAGMAPDSLGRPFERGFPDERSPDSSMTFICAIEGTLYDKPIPTNGEQGPAAAFALRDGFFQYEFRVPLTESQVRYYGLGAGDKAEIGLGAQWGGRPEGMTRGGPSGGMMGGFPGGGGGPGGGMGRPPGDGRVPGANRPPMPDEQEIWLKVKLAVEED